MTGPPSRGPVSGGPGETRRGRLIAFIALVVASGAVAAGFVARAALQAGDDSAAAVSAEARDVTSRAGAHVIFRSLDRERKTYGRVAVARGGAAPVVTGLSCDRMHMAAGRGLCLTPRGRLFGVYRAVVFRGDFRSGQHVDLNGIPTRARVSPDGRYGAATTFVSGHSYAQAGEFSTETVLIDMRRAAKIETLEKFTVIRDGRRFHRRDFNFWGVTFRRDANRFYATLASGGKTYLILGDIRARTARVLRENVECPSLSPDNRRLAYKKLVGGPGAWRFHVLDLETMSETPLAEKRHIDDQVEWLDNRRILYRVGKDMWTVRADGGGPPQKFLPEADSPAVIHVAAPQ